MDALLLVLILTVNVLIAVWNCYAVGSAWKDVMAMGDWFEKLVLRSAVIQSGVGFSMPILIVLAYASVAFLTGGAEPYLSPESGKELMKGIFSLWYLAIIFPILGSGLAIWAHSMREAYRRRDFASIATAGWNSFAQIHNMVSAADNIGGAMGDVGKLFEGAFDGDDAKLKLVIVAVLIVVVSLAAGFMIAFSLVRRFAKSTESRIEEFARSKKSYA